MARLPGLSLGRDRAEHPAICSGRRNPLASAQTRSRGSSSTGWSSNLTAGSRPRAGLDDTTPSFFSRWARSALVELLLDHDPLALEFRRRLDAWCDGGDPPVDLLRYPEPRQYRLLDPLRPIRLNGLDMEMLRYPHKELYYSMDWYRDDDPDRRTLVDIGGHFGSAGHPAGVGRNHVMGVAHELAPIPPRQDLVETPPLNLWRHHSPADIRPWRRGFMNDPATTALTANRQVRGLLSVGSVPLTGPPGARKGHTGGEFTPPPLAASPCAPPGWCLPTAPERTRRPAPPRGTPGAQGRSRTAGAARRRTGPRASTKNASTPTHGPAGRQGVPGGSMHELGDHRRDVGTALGRHHPFRGALSCQFDVGPGRLGLRQLRSLPGRWVLGEQVDHAHLRLRPRKPVGGFDPGLRSRRGPDARAWRPHCGVQPAAGSVLPDGSVPRGSSNPRLPARPHVEGIWYNRRGKGSVMDT